MKRGVISTLGRQLIILGLGAALSPSALASGFAITEQSVSGLGDAFAGVAANPVDASTIYFNPAGMTYLDQQQISAGLHLIAPSTKFTNAGTTDVLHQPVAAGGNGGDAGGVIPLPNFYYLQPLGDDLSFGLGINAPFGLSTEYDSNWVGRYQAIKSKLTSLNINPSLAYRVNSRFSVGGGVDIQYVHAELTQAVDYGGACVAQLVQQGASVGTAVSTCAGAGLAPQQSDGLGKVTGDDWGIGWNLGVIYAFNDATRVGWAYRSKVKHSLTGDATFTNAPALFTANNVFVNTSAAATLDLPETMSVSALHKLDPRWTLLADVSWTHWNRFKQLAVSYGSSQPDSVTVENWDNTYRYSLGATYRYNDKWTLRGGVAYDQTPIPNASYRTPRIPGNDRTWLAVGFRYSPSPTLSTDVGYAHLFVPHTAINHTDAAIGGTVVGSYKSDVNILSAQVNWKF